MSQTIQDEIVALREYLIKAREADERMFPRTRTGACTDVIGRLAQILERHRLAAMDAQAVAICELFAKYDMVCDGASILPNLEMLLMDFKKVCREQEDTTHALRDLVDACLREDIHTPHTLSALQEARVVLRGLGR